MRFQLFFFFKSTFRINQAALIFCLLIAAPLLSASSTRHCEIFASTDSTPLRSFPRELPDSTIDQILENRGLVWRRGFNPSATIGRLMTEFLQNKKYQRGDRVAFWERFVASTNHRMASVRHEFQVEGLSAVAHIGSQASENLRSLLVFLDDDRVLLLHNRPAIVELLRKSTSKALTRLPNTQNFSELQAKHLDRLLIEVISSVGI